jgi:hypothetical protein
VIVVAAGRGMGRTTALATWLLDGHPVPGWPGWSRVLVLPDARRCQQIIDELPGIHAALREAGTPGFGKLAITLAELHQLGTRGRGRIDPDVTFALDDADHALASVCGGITPAVISVEGVSRTVAEIIATNTPAEPEQPNWPHEGGTPS